MVVKIWFNDPQLNCMLIVAHMKVECVLVGENYDLNENLADFFE